MNLNYIDLIESELDRKLIEGYEQDKEFKKLYSEILKARDDFTKLSEVSFCDLDRKKPGPPENKQIGPEQDFHKFEYFFTCAFPDNHLFMMKYLDIGAQSTKWKIGPKKYRECTPMEQYAFINRALQKNIQLIASVYHIFYEQHASGDLHIHGRIRTPDKMNIKTLKTFIHRIFDCPMTFKYFCDIKVYDHAKWNEYDQKRTKTYQTTQHKEFKNI